MQTTQANMEDVFKIATIEFNTGITKSLKIKHVTLQNVSVNYLANGVGLSANGLEYNFSNTVIYQDGPLTFKISSGKVTFDPNFSFKSDYGFPVGLSNLDFRAENAKLTIDCDIALSASAEVNLPKFSTTLADFDKKLNILVLGIPVIVVVNTKLVAELSSSTSSNLDINTGFENDYLVTTGVTYENTNWTGTYSLNSGFTPKPFSFGGEVNISQNLTITPRVSLKFYGVIGPYCQPEMTEDFAFNIASPSLDWDAKLKAGLGLTTGVDIAIFGSTVADFSIIHNYDETIWNAPDSIIIISGNDQSGELGQQLPNPLKVKVTDNLDNPLKDVPVYYTVTQGGGTVDTTKVLTDLNGLAEVLWTLGNEAGNQVVNATVNKADGSKIRSTVYFDIASNTHDLMIIRVTNLLDECDDCDTPGISWNSEGAGNVILGYGESVEFKISTGNPFIYLWTCYPGCDWIPYSTPVLIDESFDVEEYNPNHRKLRFTRVL
jgi:hypothetical protein